MVGSTHLPHGSQKQGGASVPPEPRQYPFIGQCCTNVTPGPGPPATSGKVTVGLRIPHPGLEPGLGVSGREEGPHTAQGGAQAPRPPATGPELRA